jgi:hypothetical protein
MVREIGMTEHVIPLHWKGPVRFECFSEKKAPPDHSELANKGVYLHCFKMGETFVVSYVGKAASMSIWKRNQQHYGNIRNFLWALFDWQKFKTQGDLDVIFIPNYDDRLETEIKRNSEELIDRINLFYAPVPADAHKEIGGIEGAIQIHLWRNMATRKYLITPISNYSLRDKVIENVFEPKQVVLGFDGERRVIRTPISQQSM